jgi:hypothetical protein
MNPHKSYWSFNYLYPSLIPWNTINYLWNLYTSILKNHLQPKGCYYNEKIEYECKAWFYSHRTLLPLRVDVMSTLFFYILIN